MSNEEVKKEVVESRKILSRPKKCPEDLWELIKTNCFAYEPITRISFEGFDAKFQEYIKNEFTIKIMEDSFFISKTNQNPNSDTPLYWNEWGEQVKSISQQKPQVELYSATPAEK